MDLSNGATAYVTMNGSRTVTTNFAAIPCPTPGTPSGPSPSNGSTDVSTNPTLSWGAASNADSYDFYFGISKGIVIDAWARVSLVGIELLAVEARVVAAGIETFLKYAEAVGLTQAAA